jgi:hypothetical protein
MDVYRIENFKRLKMEGERAAAFDEAALNLATAYGLGIQGLELNAVGGNLMPVGVLRKSMWKEKVVWFGLAAGVAAVASAVMFIRPVKDHFEIVGRFTDPIVQTVQTHARELKDEANREGVTSAGDPDYRGANMVALLDKREVYDLIAGDLAQVFAAGDAEIPTWAASLVPKGSEAPPVVPGPAFNLVKFNTEYAPPVAATDFNGAPILSGTDRPDEPPKISGFPRIKCELEMTTGQPEPRRLLEKTVSKWLEANKKRPGVPYTLVFSDPSYRVTETGREASLGPVAGAEGPPGGRAPGVPGGRTNRGLRPEVTPQPYEEPEFHGEMRGGNVAPPSKETADASAAQAKLDTAAPLVEPADSRVPVTATIKVTWWVVFMPEQPAEGGNK